MIPTSTNTADDLESIYNFEAEANQPSKTYKMNLEKMRVQGTTDEQAAMTQAIYKILNTERYKYPEVYSDNYGVELSGLYGKSLAYVQAELPRLITAALTWDERITSITNFETTAGKQHLNVSFTAVSIYGDIQVTDIEVNY